MPEIPTFGRYAEIPYDEMTPEQQEAIARLSMCEDGSADRRRSGCTTRNWRRSRRRSVRISARVITR